MRCTASVCTGRVLQEFVVAEEAGHGVRGEAHLDVDAAIPGLARERRHLPIKFVGAPAPNSNRTNPRLAR